MAARVLPVIRSDHNLVPCGAPLRYEGRQHLVHHKTRVVHFLTVMEKPVAHAVEGAGVQHAIVEAEPQAQVGERRKQINV